MGSHPGANDSLTRSPTEAPEKTFKKMTFLSKIKFSPQSRQDRKEKVVFDLSREVLGQIKKPDFFRHVYGRRHGAPGESVVNPEPHVVQGQGQ
jgi:hypothetical protein